MRIILSFRECIKHRMPMRAVAISSRVEMLWPSPLVCSAARTSSRRSKCACIGAARKRWRCSMIDVEPSLCRAAWNSTAVSAATCTCPRPTRGVIQSAPPAAPLHARRPRAVPSSASAPSKVRCRIPHSVSVSVFHLY